MSHRGSPQFQDRRRIDRLVSTIHIADKQYFEALQRGLEYYDCVLYEMVATRKALENLISKGKLKPEISEVFNVVGFIQRQMARTLSLDFQADCLDYEGEKWQHADLDYETFELLQDERGENIFTLAKEMTLRSTLHTLDSTCFDTSSEYSELGALSRLDLGASFKIFLAKGLTSELTEITAAIEEKSVILDERNRVAAKAPRRAIDSGHRRIAVLYGGGHMPDLGRRLRQEFDMVPSHVQWITAWSIKNKQLDGQSLPFLKALAGLSTGIICWHC